MCGVLCKSMLVVKDVTETNVKLSEMGWKTHARDVHTSTSPLTLMLSKRYKDWWRHSGCVEGRHLWQ